MQDEDRWTSNSNGAIFGFPLPRVSLEESNYSEDFNSSLTGPAAGAGPLSKDEDEDNSQPQTSVVEEEPTLAGSVSTAASTAEEQSTETTEEENVLTVFKADKLAAEIFTDLILDTGKGEMKSIS